MRVAAVLSGVLWVWVCLATGAWSAKRGTNPTKKRGTNPTKKWCRTRHTSPVPAQSGYQGYCKQCFKQEFPRKYAQKAQRRLKVCPYCGNEREMTAAGFCKPCTKARSCKVCSAVNVDRNAATCSMCFQRRASMGATQAALTLWCESCTTLEQRAAQLCDECFKHVPSKCHHCGGGRTCRETCTVVRKRLAMFPCGFVTDAQALRRMWPACIAKSAGARLGNSVYIARCNRQTIIFDIGGTASLAHRSYFVLHVWRRPPLEQQPLRAACA